MKISQTTCEMHYNPNYGYSRPINLSARCNSIRGLELLIQSGVSLDAMPSSSEDAEASPLSYAIARGIIEATRVLVERGALQCKKGLPYLHLAVSKRHAERVRLLLSYGASPHTKFAHKSSFELAVECGHREIIEILAPYSPLSFKCVIGDYLALAEISCCTRFGSVAELAARLTDFGYSTNLPQVLGP